MDHFRRGNHYQEITRYRSAEKEYKAALALDPEQPVFLYNLGLVYYSLHLYDLSIQSYQKALEINPTFSEAWYNLSLALYQVGETDEAFMAKERYHLLNQKQQTPKNN